ncbi:AEC family transporter [Rummeliibacillus sp. NPDC094406]|uniref:AEC family transporter n=1 Tax=Rummeliibacillus sp. NPDC094406 TaxID=3364511 RepID=UPI0037FFD8BE
MDLFLIILPVLIVFLIGYIGQKIIGFDIKTISTVSLYLMSPFLAFRTFYTTALTMDYLYICIFAILLVIVLFILTWIWAYFLKAERSEISAMMLGAVFMNSGNYGAPVVMFALGSPGFHIAVIIMVLHSLLMNSLGIFFAAIGGKGQASIKQALRNVYRMPVLYACIIGILLQLFHVNISKSVMNGVDLIADASIPVVMLVLGMQLASIKKTRVKYRFVTSVSFLRIIVSPLVATAILWFMPVSDLIKSVLIIQAAMPAAANTTMLALQFDTEPDLVSFTTFITTIISIFSIPVVMYFLGI